MSQLKIWAVLCLSICMMPPVYAADKSHKWGGAKRNGESGQTEDAKLYRNAYNAEMLPFGQSNDIKDSRELGGASASQKSDKERDGFGKVDAKASKD